MLTIFSTMTKPGEKKSMKTSYIPTKHTSSFIVCFFSNLRDNLGTWLIKKKTGSAYQSMRMGNLKLVHKISSNTFELYDLSKDVNERNNIISDVDEETVKAMYRKLREIGPCRDRKWPIYISKLRKKLPCHFFQMDKSRCNEHPEGWLKCPMSCADSPKFFC